MSFGFDPSIILAGMPRPPAQPTLNDTLQTLAQLRQSQTQDQLHQATLADLLQRRGQEATLANIYRENSSSLGDLPSALMRGGFGAQGLKAQDHLQELRESHLKHVGQLFSGVDTPEKWAAARQLLASNPDPMLAVYGEKIPEQFDPGVAERLAALSPRTAKMGLTEEERDARSARADLERAKAERLRRGPAAPDEDKRENLRLRNQKLRNDLGDGDAPNKLLTIEGYDLDPGFSVKPEVAEKLRTAQADTRSMKKNVDDLMGLYEQYGNKVLPSTARARMSAIATHLQLKAKGETMFKLGVIAGPDMGLLNSVISDPTKKEATIRDFFSGGGDTAETMEKLRVMREQLDENLHSALESRGYKRRGGGAGGGKKVRVSNGKETLEIDAADLAEAEADGFRRLK